MPDLFDVLIQAVAFALLSLGTAGVGWLAPQIARWLRLSNDERIRAYLLQALEAAVEYGQAEARRQLAGKTLVTAGSSRERNIAAEAARDYVQTRVPDALGHFGIDTVALDQMIRARLPSPPPYNAG